jgi:hypothetical protein
MPAERCFRADQAVSFATFEACHRVDALGGPVLGPYAFHAQLGKCTSARTFTCVVLGAWSQSECLGWPAARPICIPF